LGHKGQVLGFQSFAVRHATATIGGQTVDLPLYVDMRGMLQFLILWELRDAPLHGREIARRIGARKGDTPNPGTIYPALQGLTKRGLLERRGEGRRIAYALTAEGRRELGRGVSYFKAAFADVVEFNAIEETPRPSSGMEPRRFD
jgi:DNA-binding PadR family transcriptional regulator